MDPLQAPRRTPPSRRDDDKRSNLLPVAIIVIFVAGLFAAIALMDRQYLADRGISFGTSTPEVNRADATGAVASEPGEQRQEVSRGFSRMLPTQGERKVIKEAPLQQAEALPRETFAGPVTHVTDTDVCRSLRSARQRVQEGMAKPHSPAQAKEYQLDLRSIASRGTQEGCWSGGAG